MMEYQKLPTSLRSHRKWIALSLAAKGLWVECKLYVGEAESDGFIPEAAVIKAAAPEKPQRAAAALVEAGLWDRVDGGYQMHDYRDHQPDIRALREGARARKSRQRHGEVTRDSREPERDLARGRGEVEAEIEQRTATQRVVARARGRLAEVPGVQEWREAILATPGNSEMTIAGHLGTVAGECEELLRSGVPEDVLREAAAEMGRKGYHRGVAMNVRTVNARRAGEADNPIDRDVRAILARGQA